MGYNFKNMFGHLLQLYFNLMHFVATTLKLVGLVYYRVHWENVQVSIHYFEALYLTTPKLRLSLFFRKENNFFMLIK